MKSVGDRRKPGRVRLGCISGGLMKLPKSAPPLFGEDAAEILQTSLTVKWSACIIALGNLVRKFLKDIFLTFKKYHRNVN